ALVTAGCTTSEPPAQQPSQQPSPSASAPPSSPGTDGPTGSPVPSASAYPSVETLDEQMARRGLERVPPSTWNAASFAVASFNVLGASHTRGPGRRKGYADARARLPRAIRTLERSGATVAGFQEFQSVQVRQFHALVGDRYGVYPGVTLGPRPAENSIVWRTDTWEAVRQQTTPVPYFEGGRYLMPQVLLRHLASGRLVWFGNFHNPANTFGDASRWRAEAIVVEAELAKRLGRHGTPVVFTGDMNERAAFACPFTAQSGMHSADGARTRDGQCLMPPDSDIDWILGSAPVRFTDYLRDRLPKVRRVTDHPLVTATATLLGVEQRPGCQARLSSTGAVWYCRRR
ncbi:MAG: endonuclease/exonuclease/phosphatase family protein, partial [Nocardioides sp.]